MYRGKQDYELDILHVALVDLHNLFRSADDEPVAYDELRKRWPKNDSDAKGKAEPDATDGDAVGELSMDTAIALVTGQPIKAEPAPPGRKQP